MKALPVLAAIAALVTAAAAAEQAPGLQAPPVLGSAQDATSQSGAARVAAEEVALWFDAVFTPMQVQRRYAGLAVAVVQDGTVLFIKGYGFADAARRTPMAPDRTRLRIGSITKTMTATLILQLLDEGRIRSLDDRANDYLRRYRLPEDRGVVTLRHLLTHTAGFEAFLLGLGTERTAKAPADASYIRQHMPRQVRAPGGPPIYSNFCFQTLGAIVEDLTGQTMAEALSQRLLQPLDMSESALPYALQPSSDLGQPYAFFADGELQAVRYVALHPFSSSTGGVEATAADVARYMIAQLDEDGTSGRSILPPRLLHEMHRRQAGANASVSGLGLGIFVRDRAGVRILDHPGGWPGFHSLMTLIPERQLGVFISAMAEAPVPSLGESLWGSARLRPTATPAVGRALNADDLYEIREAFLDRFVSVDMPSV
ncbi:MAG: serine hydrolase domain-containing protein, partial [Steroidobacteraceae bacterium]